MGKKPKQNKAFETGHETQPRMEGIKLEINHIKTVYENLSASIRLDTALKPGLKASLESDSPLKNMPCM